MSEPSANAQANAGKNEATWQVTDFGVNEEVTWQVKDSDHPEEGDWTITDFEAKTEETWSITDYDHNDSDDKEPAHNDSEEAVVGQEEHASNIEEQRPVNEDEEMPMYFYDHDIEKLIEAFPSTRKMRWWDSEKGKYVAYFSQLIDDALDEEAALDRIEGHESQDEEGEAEVASEEQVYRFPEI